MKKAKKDKRPVIWRPTPKQAEFLSCPAREACYGGSLGGGKSDCLLMCAVSQVENPKHWAIFFRRTFPELRTEIDRSHELFRPLGGVYNVQTSTWVFPSGAKIEFAFLDSDSDRYRYLGRQFNCILWDELCEWPNDSAYVYLLTRLRTTKDSGLRLEVRASANPLGPGASWVKRRFAIPDDGSASECVDPDTGYRRVFVPARIADNIHLQGSEYERSLMAQPRAERKALLDGRWDSVAGAIFSEFDHKVHVCEPFACQPGWQKWRSCDDGYRAPCAILWLMHDRDLTDTIYVCGEVYQTGMTPVDVAQAVTAIDEQLTGERWSGVIDSAAFADTGASGDGSRGAQMNRYGLGWRPCEKGSGSIVAGLSAIHARLQLRSNKTPGLKIFRTCKNLISEIVGLTYDPSQTEVYDGSCPDHAVSALRYGLLSRPYFYNTRAKVWGL
jgi:hypothetical protein